MDDQRWTLLCIPGVGSPVRQYSVSVQKIRYVASLTSALVAIVAALTAMVAIDGSARYDTWRLRLEKTLLSQEVFDLQGRASAIEGLVDGLIESDERYRIIAGLDAIDEEIFEVGVGGPGMLTPASSSLWGMDPIAAKETFVAAYDLSALERRAKLLSTSLAEATERLESNHAHLESMPSIVPTAGFLSSNFSRARLHPISNKELPHPGIDLSAMEGTPILSAAKGVVRYAGWKSGYGYTVEIDHGFGYMTRYAHASKILVTRWQRVERGESLAHVGKTGTATANHLHYEVWAGGEAKDPLDYILNGVIP